LEYWVWWNEICFYKLAENKKLNQIDIRIFSHFSSIPLFQYSIGYLTTKTTPWGEVKVCSSCPESFTFC